ncbi:hypothetical protein, partial [Cronobacter malonaticus]|uniref:hypothetical protein n=1 Tax=Cronobacter malonaticus TaxID=413503 RepID=UPI001F268587
TYVCVFYCCRVKRKTGVSHLAALNILKLRASIECAGGSLAHNAVGFIPFAGVSFGQRFTCCTASFIHHMLVNHLHLHPFP